jgi:DNA-binding transcriptional regulator YiaG
MGSQGPADHDHLPIRHPAPRRFVLPHTHRISAKVTMPETLNTIGDHIRRRRLGLGLIQKQVAEILDVCTPSVINWEIGRSEPHLKYMPAILRFVGYAPVPPPEGLGKRIVQSRNPVGLSQKGAAAESAWTKAPRTLGAWQAAAHRAVPCAPDAFSPKHRAEYFPCGLSNGLGRRNKVPTILLVAAEIYQPSSFRRRSRIRRTYRCQRS